MDIKKIVISIEETCDLSVKELQDLNVSYMCMDYLVNNEDYKNDEKGMSHEEFYDMMAKGAETKTAQINSFRAKEHFEELLKTYDKVFHIGFSSSLSGTNFSEKKAAEEINEAMGEERVFVLDSLCASCGQGLLVRLCAEKLKEGVSFDELKAYAEDMKWKMGHLFIVDNLKYLARSGRISKTTALIANAIKIKPVMHMDDEGKLTAMYKVLSKKKAIQSLATEFSERYSGLSDIIYIAHANAEDDAKYLAEKLKEMGKEAIINNLGVVIGSHSGPGTLALFFTTNKR